MDLFSTIEQVARERDLVGSFSLIAATSVFLIPYERMKSRHRLHRPKTESEIDKAIRRVELQLFAEAEFWKEKRPDDWRLSRVVSNIEQSSYWKDVDGQHPMNKNSRNDIYRKDVNTVLRVIRNALAHGNILYLDENGIETSGTKMRYLAFLSRYEETEEQRKSGETYRIASTTEDGFLDFVKCWVRWLTELPGDVGISPGTENT